ncbi:MAG: hypothetical protein ACE5FU_12890, partial [Nitrospinota bacterium]
MSLDLTGILNDNEFYTHHYLSAILENDIKGIFSTWKEKEKEHNIRPPYSALRALHKEFFALQARLGTERKDKTRLKDQTEFHEKLFSTLGYEMGFQYIVLDDGLSLPLMGSVCKPNGAPDVWFVQALDEAGEANDPLTLTLKKTQYERDEGEEKNKEIPQTMTFEDVINRQIFALSEPPRWVIIASDSQVLLIDRQKWSEKRLLRFDLKEILGRRETSTLQTMAALLHHDSVCPQDSIPFLDTLDENSHKHAFSVSEDLKYSLRRSIELIGNEAVWYMQEVKHEKVFGRDLADQLTRESLRYMYRLLFLFYIEARPELGYAPIKSDAYRQGYSLDFLRELEMVQLTTEESRQGYYLDQSITLLFELMYNGFNHKRD